MRFYSSSVLLFGATVLHHAELVVSTAVKFNFAGPISESLISIKNLGGGSLQIPFSGNAPFLIHQVSLLQRNTRNDIRWLGSYPISATRAGPEAEIKMEVKVNSTLIQQIPYTRVEANMGVNISLDAQMVNLLLHKAEPGSPELPPPGQGVTPPGSGMPAMLYFQVKYYSATPFSNARRQLEPPGNLGPLLNATSTYFALTPWNSNDNKVEFDNLLDRMKKTIQYFEGGPSPSESPEDGPSATNNPGASPTNQTDSPNPKTESASSSSGGLSTAAIAGIAAGTGLGFLIIAGSLTFCLLRRRHRNAEATQVHGYNGGGRSGDIIAEKEAANAAVSESGAHSPYSDDGRPHFQRNVALARAGVRASAATGAAGLMAAHHQDEQSAGADYAPYSDRPSNVSRADTAIGSTSAIGTASTTAVAQSTSTAPRPAAAIAMEDERGPILPRSDTAMSGTYAHLVEDGMTAAEIARLEDEERQLDQAIERARGVTTK